MPHGRPPRMLKGTPFARVGFKLLRHVDEDGKEHELCSLDEARTLSALTADSLNILIQGGAIHAATSFSKQGFFLVSKQDVLEIRDAVAAEHPDYAAHVKAADEELARKLRPKASPLKQPQALGPRIGRSAALRPKGEVSDLLARPPV